MEASIALLRMYWLEELGASEQQIQSTKVTVVHHGTLNGYSGVYFFRHKDACIVSTPDHLYEKISTSLKSKSSNEVFHSDFIQALLKDDLERIVGPAWVGQITRSTLSPLHGPETKILGNSDWRAFDELLSACTEQEVSHSSLKSGRQPTVGCFEDGILSSVAGYEILSEKIAHIGILTHPKFRGKGLAKKSVSAITEIALNENIGVQYRTLCSNISAVRSAEAVGFTKFAETIAARVKPKP
jgi:hypothetical protein